MGNGIGDVNLNLNISQVQLSSGRMVGTPYIGGMTADVRLSISNLLQLSRNRYFDAGNPAQIAKNLLFDTNTVLTMRTALQDVGTLDMAKYANTYVVLGMDRAPQGLVRETRELDRTVSLARIQEIARVVTEAIEIKMGPDFLKQTDSNSAASRVSTAYAQNVGTEVVTTQVGAKNQAAIFTMLSPESQIRAVQSFDSRDLVQLANSLKGDRRAEGQLYRALIDAGKGHFWVNYLDGNLAQSVLKMDDKEFASYGKNLDSFGRVSTAIALLTSDALDADPINTKAMGGDKALKTVGLPWDKIMHFATIMQANEVASVLNDLPTDKAVALVNNVLFSDLGIILAQVEVAKRGEIIDGLDHTQIERTAGKLSQEIVPAFVSENSGETVTSQITYLAGPKQAAELFTVLASKQSLDDAQSLNQRAQMVQTMDVRAVASMIQFLSPEDLVSLMTSLNPAQRNQIVLELISLGENGLGKLAKLISAQTDQVLKNQMILESLYVIANKRSDLTAQFAALMPLELVEYFSGQNAVSRLDLFMTLPSLRMNFLVALNNDAEAQIRLIAEMKDSGELEGWFTALMNSGKDWVRQFDEMGAEGRTYLFGALAKDTQDKIVDALSRNRHHELLKALSRKSTVPLFKRMMTSFMDAISIGNSSVIRDSH